MGPKSEMGVAMFPTLIRYWVKRTSMRQPTHVSFGYKVNTEMSAAAWRYN